MLNKILVICSLFLVVIIGYSFFLSEDTSYELIYEEYPSNEIKVYYYIGDEIVGYTYYISDENEIVVIFNYLTNESNLINDIHQTYIPISTTLLSYEIVNSQLFLNLSDDFLRYNESNAEQIIEQFKKSYQDLGFSVLKIKIDGVLLKNIGFYSIETGIEL